MIYSIFELVRIVVYKRSYKLFRITSTIRGSYYGNINSHLTTFPLTYYKI